MLAFGERTRDQPQFDYAGLLAFAHAMTGRRPSNRAGWPVFSVRPERTQPLDRGVAAEVDPELRLGRDRFGRGVAGRQMAGRDAACWPGRGWLGAEPAALRAEARVGAATRWRAARLRRCAAAARADRPGHVIEAALEHVERGPASRSRSAARRRIASPRRRCSASWSMADWRADVLRAARGFGARRRSGSRCGALRSRCARRDTAISTPRSRAPIQTPRRMSCVRRSAVMESSANESRALKTVAESRRFPP